MSEPLLPLFPLSLVLLPGSALPLHVFEDRYKELMGDVIPSNSEFGIVLARGEGIVNIGCTAVVQNVFRRYEDGRMDLLASGRRRFMIGGLDQDKSYLRAEIEYFDDEHDAEPGSIELRRRVLTAFGPLLAEAGDDTPVPQAEAPELSFRLAEHLEDLDKRQAVLAMRSEAERLEFLLRAIPEYLLRQQRTEMARRLSPLNGHAKHITTA